MTRSSLIDTLDAALRQERIRGVPERRDLRRRRARRLADQVLAQGGRPPAYPADPGLAHAARHGAEIMVGIVQTGRAFGSALDRFVQGLRR